MTLARLATHPCVLVAALAGCMAKPPLQVDAMLVGGECRLLIGGRMLTIDEIRTSGRQWRGRALTVRTGTETPFRCVGGAIFALQRAGARRVGFIAEPRPKEERE